MSVNLYTNLSPSLAFNATVIWRARLTPKKLHYAAFVHNLPIITAVTQNHGDGQKYSTCSTSWYSQ